MTGNKPETFEFQTEARQLLDLMVRSLYSNKEIFLRELISNSSDALDKRRFEALTRPEVLESGTELEIFLEVDGDARTLTVRDNGIGMSRDEVVNLIGTIAKSGTKKFLQNLQASQDKQIPPELIGQFGVGFYSSFMVADRVTLITRRAGTDEAVKWESTGEGSYALEGAERDEPGTSVTLHLKDADDEDGLADHTSDWVLRSIVKKYSDFVAYPIKTEVKREKEVGKGEDAKTETVTEIETLNSMKAIWIRPEDEVSEEEYNEFYKHISHDWNEPLLRIRSKIEGTLEYRMLLFVPGLPPLDLFHRESVRGVHLYVKRVFIMDDCKELLPEWLRFVRGVVDSEDLSLNISREILQKDRQVRRMRKGLVSKVLGTFQNLRETDEEKFLSLWKHFDRVLKEGLYNDSENSSALLDLALFESTHDAAKATSLGKYVERMKEGQESIYYLTGESRDAVENSPQLEALLEEGYEVLILTDPVDELWTERGLQYDGKSFKSAIKGDMDAALPKATDEDEEEEYKSVLEYVQGKLDEHVKEVRLSSRLRSSAACLVSEEGGMTPMMEELLRASNQEVPTTKRILEINPKHPILAAMQKLFDEDRASQRLADYTELLHGQALIAEGGKPPSPSRFSKLLSDLMVQAEAPN